MPHHSAPPVPQHAAPVQRGSYGSGSQSTVSTVRPRPRQSASSTDGLKRRSALSARRQSTLEYGDAIDEDARLLRDSLVASRRMTDNSRNSYGENGDSVRTSWRGGSVQTTPRVPEAALESPTEEDNMFDDAVADAAILAEQYTERPVSPPRQRPTNKVMTPAQFERYKQDQERMRSVGGQPKEEENEDEDNYDDDEDEAEKRKQLAKQRRKQEAHMAVYRQQMMKVTGENLAPLPTSALGAPASRHSPNMLSTGKSSDEEEEDEEVPLAILAAHGFPNKNRPPTALTSMGSNPNLRASALANGGAHGSLPVFARNLPQDPYFGAGLVNPISRESLAFGHGNGSVYGDSGSGRASVPPGGLVGVIASEERSRAARRGSPNPNGGYDSMPMPQMGMPPMMAPGMMPPMGMPMGPMMPGMLTPGDQAQIQMTQQMQQFMQMQMQFMQMMTQQQGINPMPSTPGLTPGSTPGAQNRSSTMGNIPPPDFLGVGLGGIGRPASAQGRPQGRTMSMLDPNAAPWMNPQANGSRSSLFAPGAGYTPSIAPSERSNVGLPGRYRPVSQAPVSANQSRTNTMSGAMGNWENVENVPAMRDSKMVSTPGIRVVKHDVEDDEDEEEGWAEMKKKRENKRSLWRSKKEKDGLKEILGYN
jgi:hypothetical protein